jgi:hypothetical protein
MLKLASRRRLSPWGWVAVAAAVNARIHDLLRQGQRRAHGHGEPDDRHELVVCQVLFCLVDGLHW